MSDNVFSDKTFIEARKNSINWLHKQIKDFIPYLSHDAREDCIQSAISDSYIAWRTDTLPEYSYCWEGSFKYMSLCNAGRLSLRYLRDRGLVLTDKRRCEDNDVSVYPKDFIDNLAPGCRKVIELRSSGKSYDEINKILDKCDGYAGSVLSIVKKRWEFFKRLENSYDQDFCNTIQYTIHKKIYYFRTKKYMDPRDIGIKIGKKASYVATTLYSIRQKYFKYMEDIIDSSSGDTSEEDVLDDIFEYRSSLCGDKFTTAHLDYNVISSNHI